MSCSSRKNYAYDLEMQDDVNHFQHLVSMTAYNEHQSQQARNEKDNDTVMESSQNELKGLKALKDPLRHITHTLINNDTSLSFW